MWELVYHTRRYLAWSAFGIVVFVVPFLPVVPLRKNTGWLLILTGFSGSIFVLIRAMVGAVSGWSARRADRFTAIGVRRFFVGWLTGLLVFLCINLVVWSLRPPGRGPATKPTYFPAIFMAAAGVSLVLTGWIARRKRGWLLLPLALLVTFAAILGGLYALARWLAR